MPLQKLDNVSVLLKAHLAEEAEAGFPKLNRTPSSGTVKFLDYVAALTAADRDSLLATLARIDATRFFPAQAVRDRVLDLANTDPALLRYRAAMQSAPFGIHGNISKHKYYGVDRFCRYGLTASVWGEHSGRYQDGLRISACV